MISRHLAAQDFDLSVPTPRPEHMVRFKVLLAERFGEQLPDEEAMERLRSLLFIVNYLEAGARYVAALRASPELPGKPASGKVEAEPSSNALRLKEMRAEIAMDDSGREP